MRFEKKHEYFVGIDSDGTAFDSMTYKHTYAFIPVMVEVFGFEAIEKEVYEVAERINLFSMERGINRFPGLVRTFEELEKIAGKAKGYDALRDFVNSSYPMSNAGLKEYMSKHPAKILDTVLLWSEKADKVFSEKVKDLMPFEALPSALKLMKKSSDIMVVSAASGAGLNKDWKNGGIYELVDFIAGQEFGSKEKQLEYALSFGYDNEKCLMMGDSSKDYDAAKACGVMFYPVIPGKENQSIAELRDKYYPMLLKGEYTKETEKKLYNQFIEVLGG